MKKLIALVTASFLGAIILHAQNAPDAPKKPETWEEKAAARLKEPTEEQKTMIQKAAPSSATAEPKKDRKILVFWRCEGFIHTSIPFANYALQELGAKTGAFSVDLADQYAVFNDENLAQYDLILFNNTTNLEFETDAQKTALMEFISSGKGIAGIHAAADNFKTWPEAASMIGGVFNGHPWTQGGNWAFRLNDADHTLNEAFQGKGFWHTDEIYQYVPETFAGPENLRILVSLDMSKSPNIEALLKPKKDGTKWVEDEEAAKAYKVPVSWLRTYKGGRLFYTNLGHREDTYWNYYVLKHYLDGIQYALGDLEADATPTAEMSDLKVVDAPDLEEQGQ